MKDKFKDEIEFRKIQEAVSTLVAIKDEMAKGVYAVYKAYVDAGFSKRQALELIIRGLLAPRREG